MDKKAPLTTEQVIARIEEFGGNISLVAIALKRSRQGIYNFINAHPTCQQALRTSREKAIDNVESVLYSRALAGESWAVCFFLKTQAKHRGYVERQEHTGKDSGPIELVVRYEDVRNTTKTS